MFVFHVIRKYNQILNIVITENTIYNKYKRTFKKSLTYTTSKMMQNGFKTHRTTHFTQQLIDTFESLHTTNWVNNFKKIKVRKSENLHLLLCFWTVHANRNASMNRLIDRCRPFLFSCPGIQSDLSLSSCQL